MWFTSFFTQAQAPDVAPAPVSDSAKFSCTDLMEVACELAWDDWATFLIMARNHNIDTMSRKSVRALFADYKNTQTDVVPVTDACSPRQLTEFLYLLAPDRWATFKEFSKTVDLNAISFGDLLLQFHLYESGHVPV